MKAEKKWASKERQLRRTIKDYQVELHNTQAEMQRLRDATHELITENNEYEVENKQLTHELEVERNVNTDLRKSISSLQLEVRSKQTAINVLTRELKFLREGGLKS